MLCKMYSCSKCCWWYVDKYWFKCFHSVPTMTKYGSWLLRTLFSRYIFSKTWESYYLIIFIKFKAFDHMKINIWSDNIQAIINIPFSTTENDSFCFSKWKHGRLSTSSLLLWCQQTIKLTCTQYWTFIIFSMFSDKPDNKRKELVAESSII